MDESEAYNILAMRLAQYLNYTKCAQLAKARHVDHFTSRGQNGTEYQVDVQFLGDAKDRTTIRLVGSVKYVTGAGSKSLTQTLLISP